MTTGVVASVAPRADRIEPTPSRTGPCDDYPIDAVMALLIEHADRLGFFAHRTRRIRRAAPPILAWCSPTRDRAGSSAGSPPARTPAWTG